MTKAFILVRSTGEYDDRCEINLAASLDRSKIEALEAKEKAEDARHFQILAMLDAFHIEWLMTNLPPQMEHLEKIPSWPSGLGKEQITPIMRETRQAIKDANDKIVARNQEKREAHDALFQEAKKKFLEENVKDVDHAPYMDMRFYRDSYGERTYYIEEVEMI